ncbi:MAG: addiction module toxin RelE, partial [Betaproteobacteria bacterium]|nr:addiction module toxin RelE [Betaproteobacteria bacterium]
KAILVDSDAYLTELARYIVLNPVRARMVKRAEDWPWSSYRASMGLEKPDAFLAVDSLLAQFGARRSTAQARYARFVLEGVGAESPWENLQGQVFLGSDAFVETMQARASHALKRDLQIPKAQRRAPPPPLRVIEKSATDRDAAILKAYSTGGYSYQQLAAHFGVHFTTVGRIVRRALGGA